MRAILIIAVLAIFIVAGFSVFKKLLPRITPAANIIEEEQTIDGGNSERDW